MFLYMPLISNNIWSDMNNHFFIFCLYVNHVWSKNKMCKLPVFNVLISMYLFFSLLSLNRYCLNSIDI